MAAMVLVTSKGGAKQSACYIFGGNTTFTGTAERGGLPFTGTAELGGGGGGGPAFYREQHACVA